MIFINAADTFKNYAIRFELWGYNIYLQLAIYIYFFCASDCFLFIFYYTKKAEFIRIAFDLKESKKTTQPRWNSEMAPTLMTTACLDKGNNSCAWWRRRKTWETHKKNSKKKPLTDNISLFYFPSSMMFVVWFYHCCRGGNLPKCTRLYSLRWWTTKHQHFMWWINIINIYFFSNTKNK